MCSRGVMHTYVFMLNRHEENINSHIFVAADFFFLYICVTRIGVQITLRFPSSLLLGKVYRGFFSVTRVNPTCVAQINNCTQYSST